MTSYQGYNLGFRIYTIDGEYNGTSYALLDHQSWFMDIAEANEKNVTHWQYGYSAKVCQVYMYRCCNITARHMRSLAPTPPPGE